MDCARACLGILSYCYNCKKDQAAHVFFETLVPYYVALGGKRKDAVDMSVDVGEVMEDSSSRGAASLPEKLDLATTCNDLLELVRKPFAPDNALQSEQNSNGKRPWQPVTERHHTTPYPQSEQRWKMEVASPFNFSGMNNHEQNSCVERMSQRMNSVTIDESKSWIERRNSARARGGISIAALTA